MLEFKQVTCNQEVQASKEELLAFAIAIPRMLHLISFIKSVPQLYYSRMHCFLQAYSYGAKFQFSIGHLLELWEQGYLRDGEIFFYGATSRQDGDILYGLNSKTGEQLTIHDASLAINISAHRIWGHPLDQTITQPAFSGKPASFSELMKEISLCTIVADDKSLPSVKPYFLTRLNESNYLPSLPEMDFVQIPAGEFLMGYTEGKNNFFDKSFAGVPVHVDSFEMLSTPVTVQIWKCVTNQCPTGNHEDNSAVDWINWYECVAFARVLNFIDREFDYRLPTEAEWEYACRAGTSTKYCLGDGLPNKFFPALQDYNLFGIQLNSQVRVAFPNPWGLFDMGEPISEWCADSYNPVNSLPEITSSLIDGGYRVVKGGTKSNGMLVPASWSGCSVPWANDKKESGSGFRLIRTPKVAIS